MFNFIKAQFSTFSGASEAIFWVTVFPAILKTLSLLLLATGIAKTTDDDDDDDDDYDHNDDDGDDDGKYLSKDLQNAWQ